MTRRKKAKDDHQRAVGRGKKGHVKNVPHVLCLATAADLPAINAIYNHYVLTSTCTYQFKPETEEAQAGVVQRGR